MKRKKTEYQRTKDKAWKAFSWYIRLRDAVLTTGTTEAAVCCTCGKAFPVNDLQAGHFIPGRKNGILFDDRGVHAQCRGCNLFGGGKPIEYQRFMLKKHGQGVIDDLYIRAWESLKFDLDVLQRLTTEYKRRAEMIELNESVPPEWIKPFTDELIGQ